MNTHDCPQIHPSRIIRDLSVEEVPVWLGVLGIDPEAIAIAAAKTAQEVLKHGYGQAALAKGMPGASDPTISRDIESSVVTQATMAVVPTSGQVGIDPMAGEASTRGLPTTSRIDSRVEGSVKDLFKDLRREARERAVERLYRLNEFGIEWHGGVRGFIYLADERSGILKCLKGTAYSGNRAPEEFPLGENGIVPRVYRRGVGELDVEHEGSRLAVPIYAPNSERKLGVYLLEADRAGAFTRAQVRELQRQVVFFTPQIFVLEAIDKADDFSTWSYHPEVHGWKPETLLTRFCRRVAESLSIPGTPSPACTIWNVDWQKHRCWVLATHGYDSSFRDRDTLSLTSAVARVAGGRQRTIEWGSPDSLKFVCLKKAQEMGVHRVIISSLHEYGEQPFSGTLNITFFDERRQDRLPSRGLVNWLAERGERLIASFYAQRLRLATPYLLCELAKEVSAGHGFAALLRTSLRCLGAPVGSVFARVPNTRMLQCVETTGLEGKGSFEEVTYDLNDSKSLTCWAALNPDKVARHNWGPIEEGDIPRPSNQSRERMVPEGSYHRRSLIKGVALLRGDPEPHVVGAIRIMRPGRSLPWTIGDERLVSAFAESSKKLFTNWGFGDSVVAQSFNPPMIRIVEVARGCVVGCSENKYPIVQASVFVRDERRLPEYRLYAYYCPECHGVREEMVPEPSGDHVLAPTDTHSGRMIVLKTIRLGEKQGMRICVPLRVWSGAELVEAVLALDFEGTGLTWPRGRKDKLFRDAVKLPAIWASNPDWYPRPEILERKPQEIVREYLHFLCGKGSGKDSVIRWARLRLLDCGQYREIDSASFIPNPLSEWLQCPEPQLHRFGVRLATDASCCVFPLLVGPFVAGEMVCGLHWDLANALEKYLRPISSKAPQHAVGSSADDEFEVFQRLRDVIVRATGSWCRVIAGNLLLWDVGFGADCDEEDKVIWNEEIRLKPDLVHMERTHPSLWKEALEIADILVTCGPEFLSDRQCALIQNPAVRHLLEDQLKCSKLPAL